MSGSTQGEPMSVGRRLTEIPAGLSGLDRVAGLFAGAGALLLVAVMFLPWYRAAGAGRSESAWQAYSFELALLLVLAVAGVALAAGTAAGRRVRVAATAAVTAMAFLATITVVVRLFIDRPGGNAATAVAFGGFLGLAAINTVKGGAILMIISARHGTAGTRSSGGCLSASAGPR
jgi:hypothetical protein